MSVWWRTLGTEDKGNLGGFFLENGRDLSTGCNTFDSDCNFGRGALPIQARSFPHRLSRYISTAPSATDSAITSHNLLLFSKLG